MKTIEVNHGGNWVDRLLNAWPLCLDRDTIRTWAVARDNQGWCFPDARSLFNGGYFSLRLTFPFGVWVHVKPRPDLRIQSGVGWKLNGRIALNPVGIVVVALLWWWLGEWAWWYLGALPFARVQTDAASAAGVHGPNAGQATGYDRGTA